MKARFLFVILLLFASTGALSAQSGRKSTGSSSPTTPPSVTGAKSTPKKTETAPKLQLLVGVDRNDVFTSAPLYVYDTVLDNVIRRIGEAEIVFPTSGGSMNRAEAVRAAKKETTRWVVVLEIRSIYAEAGKPAKNTNQDELAVEFTTFEPQTGHIKRSGKTHHLIYANGRSSIGLPTGKPGATYSEYSIKQAALEAADRILAGFDITVRQGAPF
jgi:hypothetical protein